VLSEKDWLAIEETLYLNRIPGLVESIYEAAEEPIEEGTPPEKLRRVSWRVILSRKAVKDAGKINTAGLKPPAESLLNLLQENPFTSPPPFEKLAGDLKGFYYRRINIHHRIVYSVNKEPPRSHPWNADLT
jgi:Txe/YoeB family toxin of toxin-antitoxin system